MKREVFFEQRARGGIGIEEEEEAEQVTSDAKGKKLSTPEEVEAFIYGQDRKPGYAGPDPDDPNPKSPKVEIGVEVGEKVAPRPWTGRPENAPGITVERAEDRKDTSEWMRRAG